MSGTHHNKVGAYGAHQQTQQDGRETDKRALLNCASRLRAALDDGGKDMQLYADAIRHNQHLWTIFQVALTDPGNPLPHQLKLTLLRLSAYVDRVSFRAVTEYMPQLVTSLMELNRTIAAGLAKNPEQQTPDDSAMAKKMVLAPGAGMAVTITTSA